MRVRTLLLLIGTALAAAGCSGEPEPAPTAYSLPSAQAGQYSTAYVAEVVAAPAGDDLAAGAGEHVVIANNADIRIDMGGWTLTTGSARLPLGIGRQIDVGAQLRVYSSCGEGSDVAAYVCLEQEALDDAGDTVLLLDAAGTEVARLEYGSD